MAASLLSGESLFRDVVTYYQLGEHRTGTEAEERTTGWIAEEVERAGLKPSSQKFTLRQFFVEESSLAVGDHIITCFPFWYPLSTGPRPIRTTLAPLGSGLKQLEGKIALARFQGQTGGEPAHDTLRKSIRDMAKAGALAVVVVVDSPEGELAAINTSDEAEPWPVPVVLVGSKDEQKLAIAATSNTGASLLSSGVENHEATARNLFGRWGKDTENVVVISTPKSGWFRCGGERGPGIAILLALARWIGNRRPKVSYWLDFNSGHELHNLGTRKFVAGVAPQPENVRCWLHLGANIATWDFVDTRNGVKKLANPGKYPIVCTREDILPIVQDAFSIVPGVNVRMGRGIGEFGPVTDAGYKGFGVYGGSYRYFHTPADGPHGTAPELLEPIAKAIVKVLEAIETKGKSQPSAGTP